MAELRTCSSNFRPEVCGVNIIVDPVSDVRDDTQRILIIGQTDPASTLPVNVPTSANDARAHFLTNGSPLAQMLTEFEVIAPTADIDVVRVDTVGGTGDRYDISFVIDATNSDGTGQAWVWINGQAILTNYPAGSSSAEVRDLVLTQLQAAQADLNVTVIPFGAVAIRITTNTAGIIGGQLDIRLAYGRQPTRVTSPDLTMTLTQGVVRSGLVNTSAIAALSDEYAFVANPYTAPENIADVDAYACSQWSGGANAKYYGVHYGTPTENVAFTESVNSALASYIGVQGMLTPSYVETATYAALAYNQLNCSSPAIAASMRGTVFPTLAPEAVDVITDNNIKADMVNGGVGFLNIDRRGAITIGRAVTTYTRSPAGLADVSLQDVNAPAQLACVSTDLRTAFTDLTTGTAFRTDGVVGTNLSGNPPVVTAASLRNLLAARAEVLSGNNVIQNVSGFIQSIAITIQTDGCIRIDADPERVKQFCCLNVALRSI